MVAGKSISKTRTVRTQLGEVVVHLRQMQSAVVVAVAALRQQNCELDEDIATVLQRSVADRIEDQIERLEAAMRVVSNFDRKRASGG
jgi:membrane carboxypeptidase/penicillin-binding protein PbpC